VRRDWTKALSLPPDVLKGFVPVSGTYDVTASPTGSQYVPDASRRAEASPLLNVEAPLAPAIVAVGSPERQLEGSRALADRLRERGGKAELVVLEGLEHHETALAIADEASPLCKSILTLMTAQ
jgi:acetyl esterase/lipase